MRIHSSALVLVLAAAAVGTTSGAAAARPWGLPHSSPARWASAVVIGSIPRGGDDDSAAATAEAPVAPPPPPPPAPPAAEAAPPAVAAEAAVAGEEEDDDDDADADDLDARVQKAMQKLGLTTSDTGGAAEDDDASAAPEEEQGASSATEEEAAPSAAVVAEAETTAAVEAAEANTEEEYPKPVTDPVALAEYLSQKYSIPGQVILAAIGAAGYSGSEGEAIDVQAVENILEGERALMSTVPEEGEEVKQLTSEGHDQYLTRRALAFADMNIDDARAILLADQEDEEEEQRERDAAEEEYRKAQIEEDRKEKAQAESEMKTVNVASGFDPAAPGAGAGTGAAAASLKGIMGAGGNSQSAAGSGSSQGGAPKPAKKEDVVFEITSEDQIQSLIIESPVPVLLDVYADWCGPCKMLTPALEQMAVKAGGIFRLVKLNTDEHRSLSQALEVQSLPTVFGVKDGQIVHTFQGMPRDEDALRNFMMGLLGAGPFNPPPSEKDLQKYASLSTKLLKVAGASSFPFSARERLQQQTKVRLDDLVTERDGNMSDAEESAATLRNLLSNVIQSPFEMKFRKVNLANKVIKAKVAVYPQCVALLKSVGFVLDGGGSTMVLSKGKKAVNLAPLVVARDTIDKWIDNNRHNIAKAARKKKDEAARVKLAEETAQMEAEAGDDEYDSEEEEVEVDPDACTIKVRMEGKKRVHDVAMHADDTLSALIGALPGGAAVGAEEEVRVTCAARRLIVKSTDEKAMAKTLREHGLAPAASVVVKIGNTASPGGEGSSKSKLAERAAARKERKGGSEATMQSIGIYSKDDNAKGELIDGGGGVWYEQDITTDDEAEVDEAEAYDGEEPEDEAEMEEEGGESGTDAGAEESDDE